MCFILLHALTTIRNLVWGLTCEKTSILGNNPQFHENWLRSITLNLTFSGLELGAFTELFKVRKNSSDITRKLKYLRAAPESFVLRVRVTVPVKIKPAAGHLAAISDAECNFNGCANEGTA